MKTIHIKNFNYDLSRVGFGGMIVAKETQQDANNYVAEAIDSGVNYFDVAPTYFDAEQRLGPALQGKRDKVFLACKTEDRSAEGSKKLLESSLKNLKTDYFDLYQLHAVFTLEDVERTFGANGSFETVIKAKEQGLIRHIGFSAHSTEAALALMERFDFDSIMFPFNFVSMLKNGYGDLVLKKAQERNMAIIGIKSMAQSIHRESDALNHPKAWYHPIEEYSLAQKAVKYTLSRGIHVILPPGNMAQFRWALDILNEDLELSTEALESLRGIATGTVPLFPLKQR